MRKYLNNFNTILVVLVSKNILHFQSKLFLSKVVFKVKISMICVKSNLPKTIKYSHWKTKSINRHNQNIPSSSPNKLFLSFSSAVSPTLPLPTKSSASDSPEGSSSVLLRPFFSRLNFVLFLGIIKKIIKFVHKL